MRKGSARRLALGICLASALAVQLGCIRPRIYLVEYPQRSQEYIAQQAEKKACLDKKINLEAAIEKYARVAEENKDDPCEYAAACYEAGSSCIAKRDLVQERATKLKARNELPGAKRCLEEAEDSLLEAKKYLKKAEDVYWNEHCSEEGLKKTCSKLAELYEKMGNKEMSKLYYEAAEGVR